MPQKNETKHNGCERGQDPHRHHNRRQFGEHNDLAPLSTLFRDAVVVAIPPPDIGDQGRDGSMRN
jgi:hypothetical protein